MEQDAKFWEFYDNVAYGRLEAAKELLYANPELVNQTVTYENYGGVALVHLAAELGDKNALDMLVAAGADLTQCDSQNCNAAHYAAKAFSYHPELIKLLVTVNPDFVNQESKGINRNLLEAAVLQDDGKMVQWLLECGASDHMATQALFTAVGHTSEQPHPEMVSVLLKERPEIVNNTWAGAKPIHFAVTEGNPEVVDTLLKAGADAAALDDQGKTPLFRMLSTGFSSPAHNEEVARLLLSQRPDTILTKSYTGQRPLDLFDARYQTKKVAPSDAERINPLKPLLEEVANAQEQKYTVLRELKAAYDTATQQISSKGPLDVAGLMAKVHEARELYRDEQGKINTEALGREFYLANPETDRSQMVNQWNGIKTAALEQLAQSVKGSPDNNYLTIISEYAYFIDRNKDGKIDHPNRIMNAIKKQGDQTKATNEADDRQPGQRVQALQEALEQFRSVGVTRDNAASDTKVRVPLTHHSLPRNADRTK